MKNKFITSYIEPHEEEEAKKMIEGMDKAPSLISVTGKQMAVKLYTLKNEFFTFIDLDGVQKSFVRMPQEVARSKFSTAVGLVVKMGPECYKDSRFRENIFLRALRKLFDRWMPPCTRHPICKVGDWVLIPRGEGPQQQVDGLQITIVRCEKVYMVLSDPDHLERRL